LTATPVLKLGRGKDGQIGSWRSPSSTRTEIDGRSVDLGGHDREVLAVRVRAGIFVDPTLCKQCGICIEICPRDVFESSPDGALVVARLDDCNGCRSCELHCPDFAIRIAQSMQEVDALEEEVA
jgi:2-oxoglutarate ferredoxin oxidoreductase subunit delta